MALIEGRGGRKRKTKQLTTRHLSSGWRADERRRRKRRRSVGGVAERDTFTVECKYNRKKYPLHTHTHTHTHKQRRAAFHQGLHACLPDIIQQDNSIVLLLKVANKQLRSRALELPFFFWGGVKQNRRDGRHRATTLCVQSPGREPCWCLGLPLPRCKVTETLRYGEIYSPVFFYSGGGDQKTKENMKHQIRYR